MRDPVALGSKIRTLRRREGLTQVQLADKLGISASYLNLIEHNRRPLPAALLIQVAQLFDVDLRALAPESDARLMSDLMEAFGDPLFEGQPLNAGEVRDLASGSPAVARAVLSLYQQYRAARDSAQALASRLSDDALPALDQSPLPSEEVGDLVQRHVNYFPDLEEGAEAVWRGARLDESDISQGLVRYLAEAHRVETRIEKVAHMHGAIRRYDPETRTLTLSEVLRRGSRNFQLAFQVGLLTQDRTLDRLASDPLLTTAESRALARVALASYFAGAVLMPYARFLEAARAERYDVQLLGHRFRTSFEQTCHRLTTLRRPGSEGVPFHMVRVDIAGNISKRFSASGLRFARFSGACPRWVVFSAFLTPGLVRTQVSQMPDGATHFWVARTLTKEGGRHHAPQTVLSLGLGCDLRHARQLVYADGVDLDNAKAVVPVGPTCRLCERRDCEQRAFPALQHRLPVHENVRGISFYAPVR